MAYRPMAAQPKLPWYRQPKSQAMLGSLGSSLLAMSAPHMPTAAAPTRASLMGPAIRQAMTAGTEAEQYQEKLRQQEILAARAEAAEGRLVAGEGRAAAEEERAAAEFEEKQRIAALQSGFGGSLSGTSPSITGGPVVTSAGLGPRGLLRELSEHGFDKEATKLASDLALQQPPTTRGVWAIDRANPENTAPVRVTEAQLLNDRLGDNTPRYTRPTTGMGELGGALGDALTKSTKTTLEKKIISQSDILDMLARAQSQYSEEFHRLDGRFSAFKTAIREKTQGTFLQSWIGAASPEQKQHLKNFSKYKATAASTFTSILKELSGVAVNPTEYKRAEAFIPNVGTGIFDGDSPTQVEAKRENMAEFTTNAIRKYHYLKKHGLELEDIRAPSVDSMPEIVQQRGQQLMVVYTTGLSPMNELEAMKAVERQLLIEFGI